MAIERGPRQVYWVMAEATAEGLTAILDILCPETHLLVADRIFLIIHNTIKKRERSDWEVDYEML